MPIYVRTVAFAAAIASAGILGQAAAQAPTPVKPKAPPIHRAAKARPTPPAEQFAQAGAMRMDDWYSLGPPKEAEIEKEAPGVQIKVHDPQEDDIIVYGLRQKRDFEGAAPSANLTSPQALDAAQPAFVPNMGDSCSYKYGCFDSAQTPLRSSLFGD